MWSFPTVPAKTIPMTYAGRTASLPDHTANNAGQQKKNVLGLQFGYATAIVFEKARCQERQDEEHNIL
jgi:hypothetical protein